MVDRERRGARGVGDPHRRLQVNEPDWNLRKNHWTSLSSQDPYFIKLELLQSYRHTKILANQVVLNWCWLMRADAHAQSQICKWRLQWLKTWKWSTWGVRHDTTLLPEAWSRIANIIYNSPFGVSDIPNHAAAIINGDVLDWPGDPIWTDLSRPCGRKPIDPTGCIVGLERFLNKPIPYRTPRSEKVPQDYWASPFTGAYDVFRYLPSRVPDDPPECFDSLATPLIQRPRRTFGEGRVCKYSSKRREKEGRV
jgi:hypothetical protein